MKNPDAFKKLEMMHARGTRGLAIVLWHDCQTSKKANQVNERASQHFAGIAPIRPLRDFPDNPVPNHADGLREHDNIRQGNRPQLFYLPALSTLGLVDSVVDLRLIWPVQQSLLVERITTLAQTARQLLYDHLYWFFTATERAMPILCPKCDSRLPVGTELPFDLEDRGALGTDSST